MSWQTAHGYCWARALRMLGEQVGSTVAGVLIAAFALALPGCGFMLAQAFGPMLTRLPAAEATAFITPGTGSPEVKALSGRLEALDGVARVRLIARDQAWADLQRRAGETGQPLTDIRPNPLPDVLVVEFLPLAPPAAVETAVAAIRKQPRVDSVQAETEWYRRLTALLRTAAGLLVPAGVIAALLVVAVAFSLVRMVLVPDPAESRLLQQIGANADFLRRPFVYAGSLLLGLGAAGGLGLMAAARALANRPLAELGRTFGVEIQLVYPPWPLVVSFVAASLLLGAMAGSVIAPKPNSFRGT